jgi:alpha-amylase/alpha-mannosidase (GH57 family)
MPQPSRSIVLHGHFYQPPREDPWTDVVPEQPGAAPFHDWNEKITNECYAPIVRSVVLGRGAAPDLVVNALEWMSFDFGPTLLVWLERHAPQTYAAILEADRASVERLGGHGNAMALPYHHSILPLASARDRATELRWGIADFRRRFGREPEGMWLPETAVDAATLDAVASEGIRFTVLAPHQVEPRPGDGGPGRYRTDSGRELGLFVYDGGLSHAVAFGDLLDDGVAWAQSMAAGTDRVRLRSLATDGETFGHHRKFGEMALAKAIVELRARTEVRLENYASFLAREGMGGEVEIVAPSSWSCPHGVERWRSDCGCRVDAAGETHQRWRRPLREALEWLSSGIHRVYARDAAGVFVDPWGARDAYGQVVGAAQGIVEPFVRQLLGGSATDAAARRAFDLLEMERNALRLFTSCAWFFDDVGGIEPRQVLAYAARALELAGADGERLRPGFLERLAAAESNDAQVGTAADVFEGVTEAGAEVRRSG